MPAADMAELLCGQIAIGQGQRCELYLRRSDAAQALDRAVAAGATLLAPITKRAWGEEVGYVLDPDGHVLALAVTTSA